LMIAITIFMLYSCLHQHSEKFENSGLSDPFIGKYTQPTASLDDSLSNSAPAYWAKPKEQPHD